MASSDRTLFVQEEPQLGNQYTDDDALQAALRRILPKQIFESVEPEFKKLGERAISELAEHNLNVENNPPKLVHVDGWGKRVDKLTTHPSWKHLLNVAAEEGIVAEGYENKYKEYSRVVQFAKIYVFGPSGGMTPCPLSMTDGAAKLLSTFADKNDAILQEAIKRTTTRDLSKFWTSGQWMTERTGGSDVGKTETVAVKNSDDKDPRQYSLYGYKFFTSSVASDMAITLARITDENKNSMPGSRGLSCFFLKIQDEKTGELNHIKVHKLKEKLGTKPVPTAECELEGTKARLIGEEGRGVAIISTILNVTRLYVAITSTAYLRRAFALARSYAEKREAYGKKLSEHPLHVRTLASIQVTLRALLFASLDAVHLLGITEQTDSTKSEKTQYASAMLRLVTPLLKLISAKFALRDVSECMEALGGTGYIEDATIIPSIFRNQQVNSIWEGTTNIISIDVLRALRHPQLFSLFTKTVSAKLAEASTNKMLEEVVSKISESLDIVSQYQASASVNEMEASARTFAYSLATIWLATTLVEHAVWSKDETDAYAAQSFVEFQLVTLHHPPEAKYHQFEKNLAMGHEHTTNPHHPKNSSHNATAPNKSKPASRL